MRGCLSKRRFVHTEHHDSGAIELRAINCTLPIAEVYEDLPIAST